jgi:LytR cell envelope-related transcriptional attenuator
MTIPYALSVSHFVSTVGSDAGFAAIIGLAILVLLFFAQARETATLREEAASAAEQVRQLEYRLGQLARGVAPAPAPARAPANAPPAALARPHTAAQPAAAPAASRTVPPGHAPVPGAPAPAAPAGLGAPALASATRLIPAFDAGAISIRAAGAPAATTGAAGAAGAAGVAGGSATAAGRGGGAAVMTPAGPPPATTAGVANGVSSGRTSVPAPVAAGPPLRAGQAPPRPPLRNGAGRPPAPAPRRASGPPPRSGARGLVLALAGLAAVAVVVVALLVLTSGGTSSSHSSSSAAPISNAPTAKSHHRTGQTHAALKPSAVTVGVLNGTSTTNLAHDISVKLGNAGYKLGRIATATDQTQTATVIGYLSGQRRGALLVAKSLGLGPASVQPVDQSNQAVACPQSASCTAQVVVTIGSDLGSAAATTTGPAGTTTAAATT